MRSIEISVNPVRAKAPLPILYVILSLKTGVNKD